MLDLNICFYFEDFEILDFRVRVFEYFQNILEFFSRNSRNQEFQISLVHVPAVFESQFCFVARPHSHFSPFPAASPKSDAFPFALQFSLSSLYHVEKGRGSIFCWRSGHVL